MTNEERRLNIIKLIKKYQDDKKNFIKKLIRDNLKKLQNELKFAADSAVDKYYEYPTKYNRRDSLYDAYRIQVDVKKNDISVDFSSNFSDGNPDIESKHPKKGAYIYEWMFGGDIEDAGADQGGWHGGDIAGSGHPDPGTPWLRKGSKTRRGTIRFLKGSNNWLRQASRTESPYLMVCDAINEAISLRREIVQEEYEAWSIRRLSEIRRQIEIYVRG